ncbi:hypothetical protein ACMFMF_002207 [Clarireedia jacksonii]
MASPSNACIPLHSVIKKRCEDCGETLSDHDHSYIAHLLSEREHSCIPTLRTTDYERAYIAQGLSTESMRIGYIKNINADANLRRHKANAPLLPLPIEGRQGKLVCGIALVISCLANFNFNVRRYNAGIPQPLDATFKRAHPGFLPRGLDYMLWGERAVFDSRPCMPAVEYDAIQAAIGKFPAGTMLPMLSKETMFVYAAEREVVNESVGSPDAVGLKDDAELSLWDFTHWSDDEVPDPQRTTLAWNSVCLVRSGSSGDSSISPCPIVMLS